MSERRHEDRASEQGSRSKEKRESSDGTTARDESTEGWEDRGSSDRQKERVSEPESSGKGGQKKEGEKKQKKSTEDGKEKEKQSQDQDKKKDGKGDEPPPTWQWLVAGLSTLAVAGLLAFIVYEALSGRALPPIVSVRVERVLEAPDGYVVEVGVYNRGSKTAAGLTIEGTLKRGTVTVETSTATLSFVPGESEREAGLYFSKDPREYTLEVLPKGYDHP